MRAFLSHSSKDNGFVEGVAELLRPGSYELDSDTFDAGLLNSDAIIEALKRCNIFCLFLSSASLQSPYVDFEMLISTEFFARGKLSRLLIVCLDDEAFEAARESVKFFNVIRRGVTVERTARMIQGALIAENLGEKNLSHPFIGREEALKELERQVIDPDRPAVRTFFASGNHGIGRRSLIRKFYRDHYPNVGQIFPAIDIPDFAGLEELYRAVLFTLRPAISAMAVRTNLSAFMVANEEEKRRQIAELLNSLVPGREAAFLIDQGGVLTDSGELQPEISSVVSLLENRPHPPIAIISPRSIPHRHRHRLPGIAFVGVMSMSNTDATRLVSTLCKNNNLNTSNDVIQEIVDLGDFHPFNYYKIFEEISENGLGPFLSNKTYFIEWKQRNSSEYIRGLSFSETEKLIVGFLRMVPSLDFDAIVEALEIDSEVASTSVIHLSSLHIIEHNGTLFSVSPPLRPSIDRDVRFNLNSNLRQKSLKSLCDKLSIRIDEGSAEIKLVDAVAVATIQSGSSEAWISAFLLPSHYVWLAKQNYDHRNYSESIRLAKRGLDGSTRLSSSGFVAACRYICLPASRTGDLESFNQAIGRLDREARDDWGRSNVAFLRGFNERMMGNIPTAEDFFREAYRLSEGNHSASRELAAICLTRGNLEEAERFAREAHAPAQRNVFIVDILVAALIKKLGRNALMDSEVRSLLDLLENLSRETGRSFYDTRMAEFESNYGDNRKARTLIEEAIRKTPGIFEPRRIYANILLKDGDRSKAGDVVNWMREKVNARDVGERRTNYRPYLETESRYLTELGQFDEAKALYTDRAIFSEDEARASIREIELAQSYRRARS